MKHTILKTSLAALLFSISTASMAVDNLGNMNADKPEMDVDSQTYHSERKEDAKLDDNPMSNQLLADEMELDEGYLDPDLLADLDLDDLEAFEFPDEEAALMQE